MDADLERMFDQAQLEIDRVAPEYYLAKLANGRCEFAPDDTEPCELCGKDISNETGYLVEVEGGGDWEFLCRDCRGIKSGHPVGFSWDCGCDWCFRKQVQYWRAEGALR